jgi:hypothetical protein
MWAVVVKDGIAKGNGTADGCDCCDCCCDCDVGGAANGSSDAKLANR